LRKPYVEHVDLSLDSQTKLSMKAVSRWSGEGMGACKAEGLAAVHPAVDVSPK